MPARLSPLRKLVAGLAVAAVLLGLAELLLALGSGLFGVELRRSDPLARDFDRPVLCRTSVQGELRLCPNDQGLYEKVRNITFSQVPERPRVIAVGESFVFGLGYPLADSWPGRLQAQLGPGVEVLNFGRCGSESTGLMPTVRAALDLEPDVLVLAIGNNEYTMAPYYAGWLGRHPRRAHQVLKLLGRVHLYGLLQTILGDRVPRAATDNLRDLGTGPEAAVIEALHGRGKGLSAVPDRLIDAELTTVLEGSKDVATMLHAERLARMIDWADEAGVAVVLATLPADLQARPVLTGTHGVDREALREKITALQRMARFRDDLAAPVPDGHSATWNAAAEEAAAWSPEAAMLRWHQGASRWMNGEGDAARTAWLAARQWSLLPDATPAINDNIRELAADRDLPLVDLDLEAWGWMGRKGWYFTHPPGPGVLAGRRDSVHVGPDGAEAVATAVAAVVAPLVGREAGAPAAPAPDRAPAP